MNLRNIIFVLLLTVTFSSMAEKASHRKAAVELVKLTKVSLLVDQMYKYAENLIKANLTRMRVPKEMQSIVDTHSKKMIAILKADLVWDKLKKQYIDIYVKEYTEAEINSLIKFYKSPLGQKLLSKTPEISKQAMAVGQKQMTLVMPKVQGISKNMVVELRKEHAKLKAAKDKVAKKDVKDKTSKKEKDDPKDKSEKK